MILLDLHIRRLCSSQVYGIGFIGSPCDFLNRPYLRSFLWSKGWSRKGISCPDVGTVTYTVCGVVQASDNCT